MTTKNSSDCDDDEDGKGKRKKNKPMKCTIKTQADRVATRELK